MALLLCFAPVGALLSSPFNSFPHLHTCICVRLFRLALLSRTCFAHTLPFPNPHQWKQGHPHTRTSYTMFPFHGFSHHNTSLILLHALDLFFLYLIISSSSVPISAFECRSNQPSRTIAYNEGIRVPHRVRRCFSQQKIHNDCAAAQCSRIQSPVIVESRLVSPAASGVLLQVLFAAVGQIIGASFGNYKNAASCLEYS